MIDPLDPRSLENARRAVGLSRSELADMARVHETTIMRIEGGIVDPRLEGTWAPLVRAVQSMAKRRPTKANAA